MNGHQIHLLHVRCRDCGQPTVTSLLCERPDLCHPCFTGRPETTETTGETR